MVVFVKIVDPNAAFNGWQHFNGYLYAGDYNHFANNIILYVSTMQGVAWNCLWCKLIKMIIMHCFPLAMLIVV